MKFKTTRLKIDFIEIVGNIYIASFFISMAAFSGAVAYAVYTIGMIFNSYENLEVFVSSLLVLFLTTLTLLVKGGK